MVERCVFNERYSLFVDECLDALSAIEDQSVALIAADPPYATTENAWDSLIPLKPLWFHLRRIVKSNGAIVMTASQPFTTELINSAPDLFKYELIWEKSRATGHVHAKNKPLKKHENVLVFSPGTTVHATQSDQRMTYNPQGVRKHDGIVTRKTIRSSDSVMGRRPSHGDDNDRIDQEAAGYPVSIWRHASEGSPVHPTQKPVSLFRQIVLTYSNPGDVVLDFCMGSGTTGVAALGAGRRFVGMEPNPEYFKIARERIAAAVSPFDRPRPQRQQRRR